MLIICHMYNWIFVGSDLNNKCNQNLDLYYANADPDLHYVLYVVNVLLLLHSDLRNAAEYQKKDQGEDVAL